jgi:hypothetical protein
MFPKTMLVLLTTLGALASTSHAQDVLITTQKPLRVSIGTYNPMASSVRSAMGATLPMIGLTYDAGKTLADKPMIYGAYLDFAQNRKQGTNTSLTAFGVSGRYLSTSPRSKDRYFAGAGVGSYNVKIGSTSSKVGGKLFGGYERNDGYFGEVAYHMIAKVAGSDPSAVSFAVGRRF